MTSSDFRAQLETNFFGVVNVTRAALPVLRKQRAGHVIQISSIGGRHGTPGLSAYQSAKWAVGGFSEVLAKEVAALGIRVTVIEPGGIRTDWAGSSMRVAEIAPDYQATVGAVSRAIRGHADASYGDPKRLAQAILRVADEAQPPLRLLLGSDAAFLAELEQRARTAEDQRWHALTVSTDFESLPDFSTTPVAQMLLQHGKPT